MIRAVATASLLALVALVLYLPAANGPETFLRQVTVEHDANLHLLGQDAALRILDRTRFLQGQSAGANPIPSTFRDNPGPPPVDVTVARHVSAAGARILDSRYVRSMEALLALSLFRIASLAEWLPLVSAFICVEIFERFKAGRIADAARLQLDLVPLNKILVETYGISAIKHAVELQGWYGGPARRPLLPIDDRVKAEIRARLHDLGLV